MINRKNSFVLGFILLFSFSNLYADVKFGIGTQVSNVIYFGLNGKSSPANAISFPIKISDSFLFEPEIMYTKLDRTDEYNRKTDTETKSISIGIFKYIATSDKKIRPYVGARVRLVKYEYRYDIFFGDFSAIGKETTKEISPTLGAEVSIYNGFSISGEAALTYTKSDSTKSINTGSRLVARYIF